MAIKLLDPTMKGTSNGALVAAAGLAPRLKTLDDITIGLISNTKVNADVLLYKIVDFLREKYRIAKVLFIEKQHPSDRLTTDQIEKLKQCQATITGLGD